MTNVCLNPANITLITLITLIALGHCVVHHLGVTRCQPPINPPITLIILVTLSHLIRIPLIVIKIIILIIWRQISRYSFKTLPN